MPTDAEPESWHLEHKVPIAIIVTIAIQTFALVAWAAKLDSRVSSLETKDATQQTLIDAKVRVADERWENIIRERDRMARLEEKLAGAIDVLKRIEAKLDRSENRP